jgi:hypothetical protein
MEKDTDRPVNGGFEDDYVPRRFREGAGDSRPERRPDRDAPRNDRRPSGSDAGANRARPQRPFYDEQGRQVQRSKPADAPYKQHNTRPAADRSIDMLFGLHP